MSWFNEVTNHALNNLEDYAKTFLGQDLVVGGKTIFVNPCPFCGKPNSFALSRGFNGGHCFSTSCEESGSLITLVEKLHGEVEGRIMLGKWSNKEYNFARYEPKQAEAREKFSRVQAICKKTIDAYHSRLLTRYYKVGSEEIVPLNFQLENRKHTEESIKKYQIGFSVGGWRNLRDKFLEEGYTEEEVNKAGELVNIPAGYFVYPYFDEKGNLVRVNCKLYVRTCRGSKRKNGPGYNYDCDYKTTTLDDYMRKSHETQTGHVMVTDNTSRGDKDDAFFYNFKVLRSKKKKKAILVEGENDVLSTEEALKELPPTYSKNMIVIGMGGNIKSGTFDTEFFRQFEEIYEAFDNDEAGEKYREQLNEELPDVKIRHIDFPRKYNDIDDFLKKDENALELFENLLERAQLVHTDGFKASKDEKKHIWEIKNRHFGFIYEIEEMTRQKGLKGDLKVYTEGIQTDSRIGINLDTYKADAHRASLKVELGNQIHQYYNELDWIQNEPSRSFEELIDIFKYTKYQNSVIKQLAWYVYHAPSKKYEMLIREIRKKIKSQKDIDMILKEVNGFENEEVNLYETPPKLQISQSFFPEKGDGFMYFAKLVKEDDTIKRVPCLLTNKGEEIRLDLLRKKDDQSLLIVKNRYELSREVLTAKVIQVENTSLQYEFADKWMKGEIKPEEYHPSRIIQEIESIIRTLYYNEDDVIKVLALWIYATYFYTLFRSGFPYLLVNGEKGSGKSTLDACINLLAFNPKFVLNISEAALFRGIDQVGGTFILDEQENLTDPRKVNESGYAAVLKGGYSDQGEVARTDKDSGEVIYYKVFGPKVISNIEGVDAVIGDRSLTIPTIQADEPVLRKLKTPSYYTESKRRDVYSITSRAAISALTHFQEVKEIFDTDTRIDTGNARLTQLFIPLVTMARLVKGDYEKHLMSFYSNTVVSMKEEVALGTLEGKIKHIIQTICREILGSKDRRILGKTHEYDVPIQVSGELFEINSYHFKVLAEELDETKDYSIKEIHTAVKKALGKDFNEKDCRVETNLTIPTTCETLIRRMNGKKTNRVYKWMINVRQFIPRHKELLELKQEEESEGVHF